MNPSKSAVIAAFAAVFGLVVTAAEAQQTTPKTPPPAAKTAPAPATAAKKPDKTPSPCKGLDEKACTAKAECSWIAEAKRKDGKTVKAHCRLKSKPPAATPKTPAPPAKK